MGIFKIAPNLFRIKARVKRKGLDLRKQEQFQGTKAEAEIRYAELVKSLRGDKPKAKTFGDLLTAYAESRPPVGSVASVFKMVSRDLSGVALPELGSALERYYGLLKLTRSRKTGERLTVSALNRARSLINAVLNQAVTLGKLEKNPLHAGLWPKGKEIPRDRFLTPVEASRLLNVIESEAPHLLAITRFALQVPCRKSELVAMTRDDLDLFHNAIRVHNGTTKNEDGAWKPIPPDMVAYFRALPPETPFLFFRKVGGRYLPLGDFKKAWDRCKRLAGISNFHFHDTRHISATNMVDAGTPERAVMKVAGWRTNMLSTYYSSSSRQALTLVKFPTGRATTGATEGGTAGKNGEIATERAVS